MSDRVTDEMVDAFRHAYRDWWKAATPIPLGEAVSVERDAVRAGVRAAIGVSAPDRTNENPTPLGAIAPPANERCTEPNCAACKALDDEAAISYQLGVAEGWRRAAAELAAVAGRSGSPAARWAAGWLDADPDRPGKYDGASPGFAEHASIEAIDHQLRRARAARDRWDRHIRKLTELRAVREAAAAGAAAADEALAVALDGADVTVARVQRPNEACQDIAPLLHTVSRRCEAGTAEHREEPNP